MSDAERPRPILCLVVDREAAGGALETIVAESVAAGVDWVQLRDRRLEGADWLAFAEAIAGVARRADPGVAVIVNRRLDIALAIAAEGAHLGWDAVASEEARTLLGAGAEIGVSLHDPDALRHPGAATYAHLAPIHDPLSKPRERPALGLGALRRAAQIAPGLRILAQGGLRPENVAEAIAAGAAGVAITGAILKAGSPGEAVRAFRDALDGAP